MCQVFGGGSVYHTSVGPGGSKCFINTCASLISQKLQFCLEWVVVEPN